jgi:hypothetical protein
MAMAFGIAIASRERWGGSFLRVGERAEDASFSKSSELGEVAFMQRARVPRGVCGQRPVGHDAALKTFKNLND